MPMYCRLNEIMAEQRLTVAEACKRCRVSRNQVCALKLNDFERISRDAIDKICRGLDIGIQDLLVIYEEDPFYCVRLYKSLTVHLGACRALPPRPESGRPFGWFGYGGFDVSCLFEIPRLVERLGGDIAVKYRQHDLHTETGIKNVQQAFKLGNHMVIGSPVANRFAEYVVCAMYGVPPFTASAREKFPVNFVWDARTTPVSSFGYEGHGSDCGIISLRTGKLVGRRTLVAQGEGWDCGLIVVLRLFQPPALRRFGRDDYRIIICVLGHSGPGTLAAMKVAIDPEYAKALWPERVGVPLMRVVWAKYTRHPNNDGLDNRQLTTYGLVDPAEYENHEVVQTNGKRNGKVNQEGPRSRTEQKKTEQSAECP